MQELTSEELWTVVADVASGLRHIHERGKIHLDIKPDNIMVVCNATQLRPVIIDFGLAKKYAHLCGN